MGTWILAFALQASLALPMPLLSPTLFLAGAGNRSGLFVLAPKVSTTGPRPVPKACETRTRYMSRLGELQLCELGPWQHLRVRRSVWGAGTLLKVPTAGNIPPLPAISRRGPGRPGPEIRAPRRLSSHHSFGLSCPCCSLATLHSANAVSRPPSPFAFILEWRRKSRCFLAQFFPFVIFLFLFLRVAPCWVNNVQCIRTYS